MCAHMICLGCCQDVALLPKGLELPVIGRSSISGLVCLCLQVLLPEPLHASRTIQEACCSYASTQQLLLQASTTAHTCSSRSPPCTTAVLQQLMAYTCSLQRAGSADSNFATQQDASLDDYLLQLVQHLQEASYQNEVPFRGPPCMLMVNSLSSSNRLTKNTAG